MAAALEVAAAAGAYGGAAPAEENDTARAPLREQIKSLLVAGNERAAIALLDVHLSAKPDDALMHYNAACMRARLGDLADAEHHLRLAIRQGFLQFSVMKRDPDLAPLRDSQVYRSIMAARDAADSIIADRRNTHWLQQLGEKSYRLTRDDQRKIDVVSAADGQAADELMMHIAGIADVQSGFFGVTLPHRITIVLLEDADAVRIFGSTSVRGNYRHEMREMVISNTGRSLQHELAHAFHHAHMDELGQDHPIWVQEGLGCLFEAYRVDDAGSIEFLPNDRQAAMRYIFETTQPGDATIGARELMRCPEDRFKRDAPVCYPMARSLLEYIGAEADVEQWYQSYVAGFEADPTGEAALVGVVGVALAGSDGFESRWRKWVIDREGMQRNDAPAAEPIRVVSRRSVPRDESVMDVANADVDGREAHITLMISAVDARAEAMYQEVRPLVLQGRYDEAIAGLREVLNMSSEHAGARFDLALAHIKVGDREAARAEYELLREIDPNLARMALACLERPIRVVARENTHAAPHAAVQSSVAEKEAPLPAPPIACEEMRY